MDIAERIKYLEDYLLSNSLKNKQLSTISLFSGVSGIILLLTEIYKSNPKEKIKESLNAHLIKLMYLLENNNNHLNTFCGGLAGVGWLILYLREQKTVLPIDIDEYFEVEPFLDELDIILSQSLNKVSALHYFDLLHGSLGIGLYFLKRGKMEIPRKIVQDLNLNKIKLDNEAKWSRFDAYKTKEYIYDFGLAHGIAGILYFLRRCYMMCIEPIICKTLIQGIVSFYKNNKQNGSGSFFPTLIMAKDYSSNCKKNDISRLAWCYGDLGILHTLLISSKTLGDYELYEYTKSLLIISTQRVSSEHNTLLMDSQFCHGKSGVALIYQNIFHITKDEIFKTASTFWTKSVLNEYKTKLNAPPGYIFYFGNERGWEIKLDILSGIGGVLLQLLAYNKMEKPITWREAFYLD